MDFALQKSIPRAGCLQPAIALIQGDALLEGLAVPSAWGPLHGLVDAVACIETIEHLDPYPLR